MRNKTIKILAAVVSAALLFGGLFLLFHDDIYAGFYTFGAVRR